MTAILPLDRRAFCKLLGGGIVVLVTTKPSKLLAQPRLTLLHVGKRREEVFDLEVRLTGAAGVNQEVASCRPSGGRTNLVDKTQGGDHLATAARCAGVPETKDVHGHQARWSPVRGANATQSRS